MFTRPYIDSLDFSRSGGELSGDVPVSELPRLADLLADSVGKISYTLQGIQGKDGHPQLALKLMGVINLRCQRCLGALIYPVNLVSKLRLVSGETLDNSDIDDDEMDSIPVEKRLDVLTLLEEELLLSLPIAPKHALDVCEISKEGLNRSSNPFAILAGLKK
jgi:uncharacterized protein